MTNLALLNGRMQFISPAFLASLFDFYRRQIQQRRDLDLQITAVGSLLRQFAVDP